MTTRSAVPAFAVLVVAVAGLTPSAMAAEAQPLGLRKAEVTIQHAPLIEVGADTVLLPEPLDPCEEELSRTLAVSVDFPGEPEP